MQNTLICPNCGSDITEGLSKQIETTLRQDFELKFQKERAEFGESLQKQHADELKKKDAIFSEMAQTHAAQEAAWKNRQIESAKDLADQTERIRKEESEKAKETVANQLTIQTETIEQFQKSSAENRDRELQWLRDKEELQRKADEAEIQKQRDLSDARRLADEQATKRLSDDYALKLADKDHENLTLKKSIEDLQRKSQQGSQQFQGEVLELELEQLLTNSFRSDSIRPVAKGIRGADVIQDVREGVYECGAIVWESKRTKEWKREWLPKLKENMRNERGQVAVIVSTVLPAGVNGFGLVEGVWVCDFPSTIPVAQMLRWGLVEVARQRQANSGKGEKMELLYDYLTGTQFAEHVRAMMEVYQTLQKQIQDERKAFESQWSKREKQLELLVRTTAGLSGAVEGIVGRDLPQGELFKLNEADNHSSDEA